MKATLDVSDEPTWLDNAKDRTRRYKKKVASEVQDLYLAYQEEFDRGPLNPERRAACEHNPLLFAQTYFPEDFYLPFSDQHRVEAKKLQQAVIEKAWFANADRRGGGKRLDVRTPIPTPSGWCPIGKLKPGDVVFDKDGQQCRVAWRSPIEVSERTYEVEFSDGAILHACAEHQWYVKKDSWKPRNVYRTVTTQFLVDSGVADKFGSSHVRHQFVVPAAKAIQCDDVDLPIDPYTLGVWLANGAAEGHSVRATAFIEDADEIAGYCDSVDAVMPESWEGKEKKKLLKFRSLLRSDLKKLGLDGNKHIPSIYLRASEQQRRALLQGFCDCDSHIAERSRVRIEISQDQLATDLIQLIQSLGLKIRPIFELYRDKSHDERFIRDTYGPYVRINLRAFAEEPVFRLKRKAALQLPARGSSRSKTNAIVAIRPAQPVPMCCIEVDSPSHTYLAGEKFTVTHNSTRARMFCVWGVAYGHVVYPVLITATGKSADRNRDAVIKKLMYSKPLIDDFPELCFPFLFCRGKGQAANHMLWKGQPAECRAAADKLVIPQMDLPYSRCTQSVLQFTSMMGEIRGNSHTLPSGGTVRPDLAICDDPQTRLTARSRSETESLENTIKSDIAYMNGPDKRLGMIVPCTVIYKNDLADRLLDRKLNPQFHGERTKFMIAFPKHMDWWTRYGDLRAELQMNDYEEKEIDQRCNELYVKEREIADEGAQVSWEYAFTDNEVSAVQHGMNRWLASPAAFMAEYQNDPAAESEDDKIALDPRVVARRYSDFDKEIIPDTAQHLVMAIDISEKVLWWGIDAFGNDFTSSTVSYGTFPDQKRRYVTLGTVQETMQEFWTKQTGQAVGIGAALKMSLEAVLKIVTENTWKTFSGREISVGAIVIDLGYEPSRQIIYDLAKRPELKTLIYPAKGMPTTLDRPHAWNPATKPKPGERRGHHWRITPMEEGRQLQIETNAWKTIVAECMATPIGDPGASTVFKTDKVSTHEMWAEQMSIEVPHKQTSEKTSTTMVIWTNPGHPDNHFFDVKVMTSVAASILGAARIGHKESPRRQAKPRQRKGLREIFEANQGADS